MINTSKIKNTALFLAVFFTILIFAGCGSQAASSATSAAKESFTIAYPPYFQKQYGEQLTLPKRPEKIVVLSNPALQIFNTLNILPIAVTTSADFLPYPEKIANLPKIKTSMKQLNIEAVIALNPDLVIMGSHFEANYAQLLKQAGIPVYYTNEGPSVTYNKIKAEAKVLAAAFGTPAQISGLEQQFTTIEEKIAAFRKQNTGERAMILFGAPPKYQQTSASYLGSMLKMLGYANISDQLVDQSQRTVPLDFEQFVEADPQLIFALMPMASEEDLANAYAAEFQKNPQVWDKLQAKANNKIFFLPSEYSHSKGIYIIHSLDSLMQKLAYANQ